MKALVLSALLFLAPWVAAESCGPFLGSSGPTANFISYLESLLEQRVLTVADLAALPSENPLANARSGAARLHARELDEYLRSGELNAAETSRWAQAQIENQTAIAKARAPITQKTIPAERFGTMVQVKGGKYDWYNLTEVSGTNVATAYDQVVSVPDFEIMATPFTQKMWLDEMGKLPLHQSSDEGASPVEAVSFFSVAEVANRLSREAGLEPYYDFSKMRYIRGDAADGSLYFAGFVKGLGTNGYRVVREVEYDYLVSARGTGNHGLAPDQSEDDLFPLAYLSHNSGGRTHAVGQLPPLMFDGQALFDLVGHVAEFTTQTSTYSVSYSETRASLRHHRVYERTSGSAGTGFRLARTLK